MHDTSAPRFLLQDKVTEVTAVTTQSGLGTGTMEDAVMGVMQFRSGVTAQFHDAFTIRHAGTGLEIHGTIGSLIATDVMTQAPLAISTFARATA